MINLTMYFVLTIAAMVVASLITKEVVTEKIRVVNRAKRREERNKYLSKTPWNLVEELNFVLTENNDKDKEYNIAALVIVDENNTPHVEDIAIVGDYDSYNHFMSLDDFARDENKIAAKEFLSMPDVLDVISKKLNTTFCDTKDNQYYDHIVNNVAGGRHGYTQRTVKESFVMHVNVSAEELITIANLENNNIYYEVASKTEAVDLSSIAIKTPFIIDQETIVLEANELIADPVYDKEGADEILAAISPNMSDDDIIDLLTQPEIEYSEYDEVACSIESNEYYYDINDPSIKTFYTKDHPLYMSKSEESFIDTVVDRLKAANKYDVVGGSI